YRKAVNAGRLPEGAFRMPLSPAGNWFGLGFLAIVLVLLAFNKDTRIALYVTPAWVLVMVIGYLASRKHHIRLTPVQAAAGPKSPEPATAPEPIAAAIPPKPAVAAS
ncbi:MAG: hypothetical protein ABSG43_26280, partial [Solirubrobacteraceae bacterium]